MIKNILIGMINLYQKLPGPWHGYCKHIPTCSNYTKEALEEHGLFKGLCLGTKRVIKCNPFGSFGYDPVPRRKKDEK